MKKLFILTLSLFFLQDTKMVAQMLVPPSLADTLVYTPAYNPNCAVIDYSPNCSTCGNAQLKAVCYNNGFTIDDGINTPINTSVSFLNGNFPSADIILGNDSLSSTNYRVGLTYTYNDSLFLGLYTVVQPGTINFNVIWDSTIFIDTCNGPGPNIDIIAEYNHLFLGLPMCNHFVIAYMNQKGLHGYHARLSKPFPGDTITFADTAHYIALFPPDVAAIQKLDYLRRPPFVDTLNVALFTYRGDDKNFPNTSKLYFQEWKIGFSLNSAAAIDTAIYKFPRIAAIDDYRINNGSLANYLITNSQYIRPGSTGRIKIYSNLSSFGGTDITSLAFTNLPSELTPVVALAPKLQYTVGYPNRTTANTYFAQTISTTTGNVTNSDYYIIPSNAINYNASRMALAGTCNTNNFLLACWQNYDLSSSAYEVDEKLTDSSITLFKTTRVTTASQLPKWEIMPNPVTDNLLLYTSNINNNSMYIINDATGRTILQAAAINTKTKINVNTIPTGVYFLSVFTNGNLIQTIKFIKE